MFPRLRRRHVFYLWHLRSRDLHPGSSLNGDAVLPPPDLLGLHPHSLVNKQQHAGEAMEEEGAALPDPRDSKRQKRGVRPPAPPSLASERSFVSAILDGCGDREQKRLAAAYQKWMEATVGERC